MLNNEKKILLVDNLGNTLCRCPGHIALINHDYVVANLDVQALYAFIISIQRSYVSWKLATHFEHIFECFFAVIQTLARLDCNVYLFQVVYRQIKSVYVLKRYHTSLGQV